MRSLRQAIGFLTILPVNPGDVAPAGPARSYFPLVGLALGGALAGLDIALGQVLPLMVVGAVLLIAMLALTRALHTEGFLDVCDGLLGGYSPSERLRILKDAHVGAFAVIGGTGLSGLFMVDLLVGQFQQLLGSLFQGLESALCVSDLPLIFSNFGFR